MIRILEKEVADKIAAGEVVERPVSIVKELVENSIDAGSSSIIVEIRKGGKTYIRVSDNGSGIPSSETETAFMRHGTSKITAVTDLDSLLTLGFRGEALASIAAVSRTEMISKTADEDSADRLWMEGGKLTERSGIGAENGTTVIVRDLFFNTPAREKFMKSDSAETGAVTELVSSIALAYPEIKFRMISNGKIIFSTRGSGSRKSVIASLYGADLVKDLVPVGHSDDALSAEGFVSGPGLSRRSRKMQIFFVNGRPVDSKVIEKGIRAAYSERLFHGRYPVVFLFLNTDPEFLDVNIHPNKRQVRFGDEERVSVFVKDAVSEALAVKEAMPDMLNASGREPVAARMTNDEMSDRAETALHGPNCIPAADGQPAADDRHAAAASARNGYVETGGSAAPESEKQTDISAILEEYRHEKAAASEERRGFTAEESSEYAAKSAQQSFDFEALEVKGVLFDTYIMAADRDDFFLIDQHAAHERVYYEQILNRLETTDGSSQILMTPKTVEAPLADDGWIQPLAELGYHIEPFGPATWIVKEIPAFMDEGVSEDFLIEYIDTVRGNADWHSTAIREKAARRACKSAVKANDILSEDEIARLLTDLSKCSNPFSCPHGRPTFIKLSKKDIEKRFKRV